MKAIILAAGHGTRMRSNTQKVMHPILGKPLIKYITEACNEAGIADITIVVAKDSDDIRAALPGCKYATQIIQLGTGHAVQAAVSTIEADDDVLILAGDMPLITSNFIHEFFMFYSKKNCAGAVAAVYKSNVGDFGRVYANKDGLFESILEARDLLPESPHTNWANTSIYLFKGASLLHGLTQLTNTNSQGEFYLTDVPKILRDEGQAVYIFQSKEDEATFAGINTQAQLAEAARHMRNRINLRHMENGVRIQDPATTYIDDTVKIAENVVLYPGCVLEGDSKIDEGAIIGPYTHLRDTIIGKFSSVRQSALTSAKIGEKTEVGPFAHLRPGAVISNNCRVGNFVEVKNANIDDNTKMGHLAYIGDADVGKNVNYGCGAITVNYDGKNKYRTVIADGAFIGSNSNLVAPVEIGAEAYVAAGSTITDALPAYSLGIARARQVNKENWVTLRKKKNCTD